jgi:1-acyl-sn-glycerol-3-phosphate acyltransferase
MSGGLSTGRRSPLGRTIYRWLDEGIFYGFYFVGQALIRIVYRLRADNLPAFRGDRPVILAPNHTSFLDPIILQAAVPRRITYLMTETYYRMALIRWWFRRMGCIAIPVRGSQLAAIRLGIEALRTRGMVTIFPEGSRSPDGKLGKGYPGVATLARKTGALVVPVAISGTFEALPKGARFLRPARLRVRFGTPLDFSRSGRSDNREITGVIMDSIRALQSV